jgi:hypothetical protein
LHGNKIGNLTLRPPLVLRCKETKNWREKLVDKRLPNTEPKIGIKRIATNKDHDNCKKLVYDYVCIKRNGKGQ